jgi:hypothetical protein
MGLLVVFARHLKTTCPDSALGTDFSLVASWELALVLGPTPLNNRESLTGECNAIPVAFWAWRTC